MKNPYEDYDRFVEEGLARRFTSNLRIQYENMAVYVRVANRFVDQAMVRTLDIGTVEVEEGHQKKGQFTRFLSHVEKLAHKHGVPVYVESILNEDLKASLVKRGYELSGEPLCPDATLHVAKLNAKFEVRDDSPSP